MYVVRTLFDKSKMLDTDSISLLSCLVQLKRREESEDLTLQEKVRYLTSIVIRLKTAQGQCKPKESRRADEDSWKELSTVTEIGSPDDLQQIFISAMALVDLEDDSKSYVSAVSELGIFIRKCVADFQEMSFDGFCKLYDDLVDHLQKQEDINAGGMVGASLLEVDQGIPSDTIIEWCMLPLEETFDQKLAMFRKSLPRDCRHHYLSFLKHAKSGRYEEAVKEMLVFFDKFPASQSKDLQHYAALELAIVHWKFGSHEDARTVLKECLQFARNVRDTLCLLYAKALLLELNDGKETLYEDHLISLYKDAEKLKVPFMQRHYLYKLAELYLREGAGPRTVLAVVDKMAAIEMDHFATHFSGAVKLMRFRSWLEYGVLAATLHHSSCDFAKVLKKDKYYHSLLCQRALMLAKNGGTFEAAKLLLQYKDNFPENDKTMHELWMKTALTFLLERSLERGEAGQSVELLETWKEYRSSTPEDVIAMDLYKAKIQILQKCPDEAYDTLHKSLTYAHNPNVNRIRLKLSICLSIGEMFLEANHLSSAMKYVFAEAATPVECEIFMHHPLGHIFLRSQILVARIYLKLGDPFRCYRVIEDISPATLGCPDAGLRGMVFWTRALAGVNCVREVKKREENGFGASTDQEMKVVDELNEGGKILKESEQKWLQEFKLEMEKLMLQQKASNDVEMTAEQPPASEVAETRFGNWWSPTPARKTFLERNSAKDYYIDNLDLLSLSLNISHEVIMSHFNRAVKEFQSIDSVVQLKPLYEDLSHYHAEMGDSQLSTDALNMFETLERRMLFLRNRLTPERVGTRQMAEDVLRSICESAGEQMENDGYVHVGEEDAEEDEFWHVTF
ncbi:Anaphase-promoting complex subunit 5 [Phlyctochytrium planicorne]|nr:Anaphase-promoting complex subunit 5 [Phlyctochytrium planicorne]